MNPLQNFLEKFSHLLTSSKIIKDAVRSTIAAQSSITVQENEIELKDGVALIKMHPASKNAIFMRKKKILEELQKILGSKAPRDIR